MDKKSVVTLIIIIFVYTKTSAKRRKLMQQIFLLKFRFFLAMNQFHG